jgi:hypothetical protein
MAVAADGFAPLLEDLGVAGRVLGVDQVEGRRRADCLADADSRIVVLVLGDDGPLISFCYSRGLESFSLVVDVRNRFGDGARQRRQLLRHQGARIAAAVAVRRGIGVRAARGRFLRQTIVSIVVIGDALLDRIVVGVKIARLENAIARQIEEVSIDVVAGVEDADGAFVERFRDQKIEPIVLSVELLRLRRQEDPVVVAVDLLDRLRAIAELVPASFSKCRSLRARPFWCAVLGQ